MGLPRACARLLSPEDEATRNLEIVDRVELRLRHIARNVLSNSFTTVVNMVVGFFLAPFIVHHLGTASYGVWVLSISSINYLTLLDLGMASSVVRFVSKGRTQGDHKSASESLSAVLWVRTQIGCVVLLLSGVLAVAFPHLFHIPPELVTDARKALLTIGVTTTIGLSFGVFSSTLTALNRYDLRSLVSLIQLALRVGGVVLVLKTGHGIFAVALVELLAAAVGNTLLMVMARRSYPELSISLRKPERETLKAIWSYSFYAFVVAIAVQLVYQTDNLVVGAMISAVAVTFYSIGNSLCRYTDQFMAAVTSTFTPAASTFDAAGDKASLRSLYCNGTRTTLAISLPIVSTLILRGHNFIAVWMGPQYEKVSGTVLAILAFALMFSLQNTTAGAIAFGIAKHKVVAKWAVGEAIANLVLSVVLAHYFGIYGVAVGTLVPSLFVHLFLWPRYVVQLVNVSLWKVLTEVWGPFLLGILPFALASYAVDVRYPARNIVTFLLQTFALLPLFGLTVLFVFRKELRDRMLPRVRAYFYAR